MQSQSELELLGLFGGHSSPDAELLLSDTWDRAVEKVDLSDFTEALGPGWDSKRLSPQRRKSKARNRARRVLEKKTRRAARRRKK